MIESQTSLQLFRNCRNSFWMTFGTTALSALSWGTLIASDWESVILSIFSSVLEVIKRFGREKDITWSFMTGSYYGF